MFGSGLMQREFECDKGTRHEYDGFYRIIARASAGYNNRQYFCGAAFLYGGTANYSGLRVLFNTYTIELYSGFRI
jgi:hypothetical protein